MIFKTKVLVSHRDSGEILPVGTYITDTHEYDPDGEIQYHKNIPYRLGFISNRTSLEKNYCIGRVLDVIDQTDDIYPQLIEAGLVEAKQEKKVKGKDNGTTSTT